MCGADSNRTNKHTLLSAPPAAAADTGRNPSPEVAAAVINLDHGDPTVFESYWHINNVGEKANFTMSGSQSLSYFSDPNKLCWFLEPKLEEEIRRLHAVVGNADANGHHIVVGNGSSQLLQAALYALCPLDLPNPVSGVSAAPFYSSYPEMIDFLRSGLYKWEGDARNFNKKGTYIELVTSPNNPNGVMQEPLVKNGGEGSYIYDLAYYWPHYTPIAHKLDFDIMLFTVSKCTGHAGSRIGWALVRDEEVAKKMTKYMEISTIGVSKESQLRAAKILGIISDSCCGHDFKDFFEYNKEIMSKRWQELREVVKGKQVFNLPKYPLQYCNFTGHFTQAHPAFAWMSCKSSQQDCEKFLKEHKIVVRGGKRFGSDANYVRISMLSREEEFQQFLNRLSAVQEINENQEEKEI